MSAERSEKATEQRKRKSREKGEVVRSRELNASFAMLGGLLVLSASATRFVSAWGQAYAEVLAGGMRIDLATETVVQRMGRALLPALSPVALVMGSAFAAALIAGIAQGGGVQFHVQALSLKVARLNPASNLKQILSARSLVRLGKSLVPATAVIVLGIALVKRLLLAWPVMSMARLPEAFSLSYALALNAAWVMLAWSGLDYAMEWRSRNQRLRMTKQEVREEMRDAAANPQIKGRMRQIARAMAKQRVRADIAKASVVIMNPTHFAVALQFSFETMETPRVLAKGRDLLALQMRDEAQWAGVPIVENPPLARSLYRSVDAGQSIPFELYAAVAGVLAYLYRQQTEKAQRDARARGQARPPHASLVVPPIPGAFQ